MILDGEIWFKVSNHFGESLETQNSHHMIIRPKAQRATRRALAWKARSELIESIR